MRRTEPTLGHCLSVMLSESMTAGRLGAVGFSATVLR
jgi:hypothetical protein